MKRVIRKAEATNQAEFVRRGMAAIEQTKRAGGSIPAEVVIAKLEAKLTAAKKEKIQSDTVKVMRKIDQQVSDCIKQSILDVFQPSRIVIFGSYATDSATADSDLDILAIVGDDQPSDREAAVKGRLAIRKALQAIDKDVAFDLILFNQTAFSKARSIKGTIQCAAEQQGVVIYDRLENGMRIG